MATDPTEGDRPDPTETGALKAPPKTDEKSGPSEKRLGLASEAIKRFTDVQQKAEDLQANDKKLAIEPDYAVVKELEEKGTIEVAGLEVQLYGSRLAVEALDGIPPLADRARLATNILTGGELNQNLRSTAQRMLDELGPEVRKLSNSLNTLGVSPDYNIASQRATIEQLMSQAVNATDA